MRSFFYTIILAVMMGSLTAQPGIYTESDIEYQTLFIDAKLAGEKGNMDEQIDLLNEILKRNREEHVAYFELARVYQKQDNWELASKNIDSALKFAPGNSWYLQQAAEIAEGGQQYEKAVSIYRQLVEKDPREKHFYLHLAMNHLKNGNWQQAAHTLEEWQAITGIDEESSRKLFDIYIDAGEPQQALMVLEKLSESHPDNTRFMINLARFLEDTGQEDRANKIYLKVLELDPANSAANLAMVKKQTPPPDEAGDYLRSLIPVMKNPNIPLDNKIRELMPFISTMNPHTAATNSLIEISDFLLELYPEEAKVYALRGDVMFYARNFEKSEKAYEKSVSLDDRQFTLWDQWLLNLWELEKYDKMERVSYDAVDLFPNQVNAYILHSLALAKKGNTEEAIEFAREAEFISAGSRHFQIPLAVLEKWLQLDKLSPAELEKDLPDLRKDPFNNQIYPELMGDILSAAGNKSDAGKWYERAIERGADPVRINKKSGA